MLVVELIKSIESKRLTIKDIAIMFDVSDITIQNKIKGLGLIWNHKEMNYTITDSSVLDMDFAEYMNRNKGAESDEF